MKPITWLREFAGCGFRDYPLATLCLYRPDDRKAFNRFSAEEGIHNDGQARIRSPEKLREDQDSE
jgi:hypothetical protein